MIARLEMTPLKNHTAKQVPHTHARTHARTHSCTHARTHSCTHARTHSEGINKQQQNIALDNSLDHRILQVKYDNMETVL